MHSLQNGQAPNMSFKRTRILRAAYLKRWASTGRLSMNLDDILPAVNLVEDDPGGVDLRGRTYLRTYPRILQVVAALAGDADTQLLSAASFAYSWMPRILRLDPEHFDEAVNTVPLILRAAQPPDPQIIVPLANCLHSVVGATKVAHFLNPGAFPIWDSNVEGFRLPDHEVDQYHMQNIGNYGAYLAEIYQVAAEPGFDNFAEQMSNAVNQRLDELQIPQYAIGPLRLLDLSIWELTANDAQQGAAGDV